MDGRHWTLDIIQISFKDVRIPPVLGMAILLSNYLIFKPQYLIWLPHSSSPDWPL